MCIRIPRSLCKLEELLQKRGVEISHEATRLWDDRFGTMRALKIRKHQVSVPRIFLPGAINKPASIVKESWVPEPFPSSCELTKAGHVTMHGLKKTPNICHECLISILLQKGSCCFRREYLGQDENRGFSEGLALAERLKHGFGEPFVHPLRPVALVHHHINRLADRLDIADGHELATLGQRIRCAIKHERGPAQ